ncbi:MAG: right-handed parallel beta-helix repeat-containing protein, partial [Candidatus Krumholzibacteria bacterium]|nr:right-handed parallel beta-helix repeat-containing protein [Candidatus Krumholzibacteria bacterium]
MSRVFLLLFIATATLAVSIACVFGATWYVKPDGTGDVATIRDAINAAADADVVLLAPGTYTGSGNYNVSFAGKAITVTSEGGPEVTIIDCQGLGRGFTFNNQEGPSSVLSGVTIRNGYAHNAGAIYIAASPTIENNILMNNSANYCAAIKIAASPEIRNNLIIGNTAVYFGGGIGMEWGTPTITGNIIAYNTAGPSSTGGRGGGIWMKFSAPIIRNNTLYGNYSNVVGGIYVEGSEPIIENNIIAFSTRGRAIWCTATAHPTLTGNAIFGNLDGDALCGIDGGGNFFLDPLLCDPANGNYYLEEGSPCIAANSPNGLLVGAMPAGCVQTGSIAVRVAAACPTPDTGLLGVEVDVYEAGSGDMFLSVETDENGDCLIDELAVGDYTVTVVMPLGYSAASD